MRLLKASIVTINDLVTLRSCVTCENANQDELKFSDISAPRWRWRLIYRTRYSASPSTDSLRYTCNADLVEDPVKRFGHHWLVESGSEIESLFVSSGALLND